MIQPGSLRCLQAALPAALIALTLSGCAVPPQGADTGPDKSGATSPASPASPTVPPSPSAAAIQGGEWVVAFIEGVEGLTAPAPRIRFAGDDYVGGNAGCNNFVGKYALDALKGSFMVGPLASTRMMCVPKPQGQEDMFFKATESTRSLRLQGTALELLDAQRRVVMRLERAAP